MTDVDPTYLQTLEAVAERARLVLDDIEDYEVASNDEFLRRIQLGSALFMLAGLKGAKSSEARS